MTLYEKIISVYPDLTAGDFFPDTGTIVLQNDSDGLGDYIKSWNHPVHPEPTKQQLDSIV